MSVSSLAVRELPRDDSLDCSRQQSLSVSSEVRFGQSLQLSLDDRLDVLKGLQAKSLPRLHRTLDEADFGGEGDVVRELSRDRTAFKSAMLVLRTLRMYLRFDMLPDIVKVAGRTLDTPLHEGTLLQIFQLTNDILLEGALFSLSFFGLDLFPRVGCIARGGRPNEIFEFAIDGVDILNQFL